MTAFNYDPTRGGADNPPPIAPAYLDSDRTAICAERILAEFEPVLTAAFARLDSITDPEERVTRWVPELQVIVSRVDYVFMRVGGIPNGPDDHRERLKATQAAVLDGCQSPIPTLSIDPDTGMLAKTPHETVTLLRHQRAHLSHLTILTSFIAAITTNDPTLGSRFDRLQLTALKLDLEDPESDPIGAVQSLLTRMLKHVAQAQLSLDPLSAALHSENKTQKARALVTVADVVATGFTLSDRPMMKPLLGGALSQLLRDAKFALEAEAFAGENRILDSYTLVDAIAQLRSHATPLALNLIRTGCSYPDPSRPFGDHLALEGIRILTRLIMEDGNRSLSDESKQLCNEARLQQMLEALRLSQNPTLSHASEALLDEIACD